MLGHWNGIFDNWGVKKVTPTDKNKQAYVPNAHQVIAIEAAGIAPSSQRPGAIFSIKLLGENNNSINATYYYSARSKKANRSPEPRIGREFIRNVLKWQADKYYLNLPNSSGMKKAKTADSYTDRLLKYVPAEVVALFITLDALVRSSSEIPSFIYWAIFLFCTAATYLYLWRVAKVRKHAQLGISTVAFVVWVFALGGPFTHFDWYSPIYGGLLLPIFTFTVALYEA